MKTFLILGGLILAACSGLAGTQRPAGVFEGNSPLTPRNQNPIDDLVFARLKQLNIQPARLCSDAVFVRRVYLDVIGTLPKGYEAEQFLASTDPNKRRALIDRLLERSEFADYWAMKWSDLLRVKAEFPINLWPNAAQAYHHWIRACLQDNLPYDQFVRQLLTASGSNFRVPPVNFYRAMQSKEPSAIARTVALTFMGTRAEKWPTNQLAGLAAFFSAIGYKHTSEWKEEIVLFDLARTTNLLAQTALFPDGTRARLSPDRDPREVFANWLIDPKNPWFTQNIANRAWSWLLGRGIIQEPDDIRPDNPPSDPKLLALLEKELISSHYDLKHLFRLILNSKTYQLSSVAASDNPAAAAHFAFYPLRRLDAEVLIDALNQITGGAESYSSAIPEPFTFVPKDVRSIALEDGSITSAFLEMFGRPARTTGLESERNDSPTAEQRLHLLNSSHIQLKLEQSRLIPFLVQSTKTPREIATALYLGILSRFPSAEEADIAAAYYQSGNVNRRQATIDLSWALINTTEFLYRH
ncbi:MAG TPA: DUF1553 domain-containing protein [Candidatus Acidoferrum sp.]|nr:DUF1553 domain-containing protein [Candidatus Acidoferrum sp.]